MKSALLYYIAAWIAFHLLASCGSPSINWLAPDRIGVGMSEGNMTAFGKSNKFINNQPNEMEMDFRGDTVSTMVWLEWDLPSWEEPTDYDRYLRERIRTLNLEKELIIEEKAIATIIKDMDTVLIYDYDQECTVPEREVVGMWPKKLTEQY